MGLTRSRMAMRPLFALLGALVLLSGVVPVARTSPVAADTGTGSVSLTTAGTAAPTETFDSLSSTAGSTTNTTLPTGWYLTESGGGARDNEQYAVDTGGSTTGDIYSYGIAAATDRAFGELRSGTLIPFLGGKFTNNTGVTITSLGIAYNGEQWRFGGVHSTIPDRLDFQSSIDATDLTTGTWIDVNALDFNPPVTTGTAGAVVGNTAGHVAISGTVPGLSIANGTSFFIRFNDVDATGADDGLSVDDFSITPNPGGLPNLSINDVSQAEGDAGTTTFTFTVALDAPAGAGGVTYDISTADNTAQDDNPVTEDNDYVAQSLTGQSINSGNSSAPFTVTVNGDSAVEPSESFFVNVTNITGANGTDTQGLGTIQNDDATAVKIHDVQGNGAATPLPGASVAVEGVVTGDFQSASQLQGFFLEEEDPDWDADSNTSEGIFVFCGGCPTALSIGDRARVTGTVSEFNGLTEVTATTAPSVVVMSTGNTLPTSVTVDLPIVGNVNTFYETLESMRVTFNDTLTVSEYFELARFGQIILYEGGRPSTYTEENAPSAAGVVAHLDDLNRRRVILDDDDNGQESFLSLPNGQQSIYHPQANGGFSVGTQGIDFFRGGDTVASLTGILQWGFPGFGADTWRLRPTPANPVTFTVANPRPATPPAVGGAIKAVGMNLLNYFTTIDTTASTSTGPCGPTGTLDCRGADSVAELNRQRERASIVVCDLNADVYAFMELENTTASDTINDLLGAINARCGGAHPYAAVSTGGTLGTDAIRVQEIYRTGVLSPVGSPLVDLDPIHNRPPTAQTFDVVDSANPAFGQRFTVIANHFKSKGCGGETGADVDSGDGQGCFNGRRTSQAARLLTWISSTVVPAAGDPDVLLLGDFNSYAKEDPIATLEAGGFTNLSAALDAGSYSYLFDSQLGHLDYGFASSSLLPQVTDISNWHINADEADLLDYNDEVFDSPGEASFEEKPDGSALVPPRVVFQPGTPYRASDHDPVILGLFQIADLEVTKTDSPDPVTAGENITYTITVKNNGPDAASSASLSDTLPAGTTFASLSAPGGWSCTTPAIGAGGTVSCSNPSFAVGSAVFTLIVKVGASVTAGTVITNTATATSSTAEGNPGNESGTATTTVAASADLSVTKVDDPDPVTAGSNLTYTITVTNAGPSNAASTSLSDTLPAGTTFVSLSSPVGWSCSTPIVGGTGIVSCSIDPMPVESAVFTLTVQVNPGTPVGTVISNTATVVSATTDPNPGDESGTAMTTVAGVPNDDPVACFTPSTTDDGDAPTPVHFDASCSSDDTGIQSYDWDFGDGSPHGSGVIVDHTYTIGCNCLVTLTVTDDDTATDTATATIDVIKFHWRLPTRGQPNLNEATAGEMTPVYFTLGGDHGLDVFEVGWPHTVRIDCTSGLRLAGAQVQATNGASPPLKYNAAKDRYVYRWITRTAWAGTCRMFQVRLPTGQNFQVRYHFQSPTAAAVGTGRRAIGLRWSTGSIAS